MARTSSPDKKPDDVDETALTVDDPAATAGEQQPGDAQTTTAGDAQTGDTAVPAQHAHRISDGGSPTLALPDGGTTGITVTDRTTGRRLGSGEFEVRENGVAKPAGVWARGRRRWLVECDVQA